LGKKRMRNAEQRPAAADIPGQTLPYPASQADMTPAPDSDLSNYKAAGKLRGKVALITGGDSGIGQAVAIAFAMEGANVAIVYNENDGDADTTRELAEARGQRCLVIKVDVRDMGACRNAVAQTVEQLGGLNVLVNNAAYQMAQQRFEDISEA
jgi:NADP-dependent 3-hydroxy acid dehydrogenase YdfG